MSFEMTVRDKFVIDELVELVTQINVRMKKIAAYCHKQVNSDDSILVFVKPYWLVLLLKERF